MKRYPLFRRIFFSKFNLRIGTFIFLLCALITLVCTNFLLYNVANDDKIPNDNYIELLAAGQDPASYIQASVTKTEFQNKYAKADDHLVTDEVLDLSNKSYVEKVYVVDEMYMRSLQNESSELQIVSIPNIITQSPNNKRAYPGCSGFLLSGTLPKDNKSQAVVSYQNMQKYWDYKGDINDIIGKVILINNKEYTVVGITNLPIVTISYEDNNSSQYAIIEVSQDSKSKLNDILELKTKNGYDDSDLYFENVFIKYKEGSTEEVMSYLVEHAPTYQYSSNYVAEIVKMYQFKTIAPKILMVVVSLSLILAIAVIIVGRTSFKLVYNYLKDIDNLNFQPRKNTLHLYAVLLLDYVLILPIMVLLSWIILGSNIKFLLPFYTISIGMFILAIFILKISGEKND